jgi:NTE family protein
LAWIAAGLGLSACSSAPKHPQSETPAAQGGVPILGQPQAPAEEFGPPAPPSANQPTTTYGPEPVMIRPVVLVLGPGLARGFAYVGAIRALTEAKIPIGAVLGTEMGAFVGAVYAMDAKINHFEWALQRFKDSDFVAGKSLLPSMFQRRSTTQKLEEELDRVFGKKDLNQSKLPIRVALQTKDSGSVAVLERGPVAAAVRGSLADPELYDAGQWNGQDVVSAAKSRPFLVAEARAMGLGPVVVVDATDEKDATRYVSSSELKDADLVIRPELQGIGPLDFQKRTETAFRGKKAVAAQLPQLRQLVGLPGEVK